MLKAEVDAIVRQAFVKIFGPVIPPPSKRSDDDGDMFC